MIDNQIYISCRALDLNTMRLWKMREYHVIFMYKGFVLFQKFQNAMKDGEEIIEAYKNLLLSLHLTKGFSSEV
jgi:hypothetical protein